MIKIPAVKVCSKIGLGLIITVLLSLLAGCDGTDMEAQLNAPADISAQPSSSLGFAASSNTNDHNAFPLPSSSSLAMSQPELTSSVSSVAVTSSFSNEVVSSSSKRLSAMEIELLRTYSPNWKFDITDIAVDTDAGHVYIVDKNLPFIYKVDIVNGELLATIPLPFTPGGIAFSKQATTVVATSNDGTHRAKVFDTDLMTAINEIKLGYDPFDVVVLDSGLLVFSSSDENRPAASYALLTSEDFSIIDMPVNAYLAASNNYVYSTSIDEPHTFRKYLQVKGTLVEEEIPYWDDFNIGEKLIISPDANYFLTSKGDYFDTQYDDRLASMAEVEEVFREVAFTPNSELAITLNQQGEVKLHDVGFNFHFNDLVWFGPRVWRVVVGLNQPEHIISTKRGQFVIHNGKGLVVSELDVPARYAVNSSSSVSSSIYVSSASSAEVVQSTSSAGGNNSSSSVITSLSSSSSSLSLDMPSSSNGLPVTYFPETPMRIALEHSISAPWHTHFTHFDIDDLAVNTETGIGYALDKSSSLIFELNILTGEMGEIIQVPADPAAFVYLQEESLIAVVSTLSPRLVVHNTADYSLVDTVGFSIAPANIAMSKAGIIAVSFKHGSNPLFLYNLATGKVLDPIKVPRDAQLSFVGETLLVTSASDPERLLRYLVMDDQVIDLGWLDFDGIDLGAIIGNSATSEVIVTENGYLLDKSTYALVGSINYGQSHFQQIEFLNNSDYALSVDDQNYIRLFDARINALDYGLQEDPRRIGANSSLQSGVIEGLAIYGESALVIHDRAPAYGITQLILPPYLADKKVVDPFFTASTSSIVSSVANASSTSSANSLSSGSIASSSFASRPVDTSSTSSSPYVSALLEIKDNNFDPRDIRVDHAAGVIYIPESYAYYEINGAQRPRDIMLTKIDLRSGQAIGQINATNRLPSRDWAANEDLTEFWVAYFNPTIGTKLQWFDKEGYWNRGFEVNIDVTDMFVTDDYIFALGSDKADLHQYRKSTGELMATIETGILDDWLVLPKSQLLYTLNAGQVKQYSFAAELYETDLHVAANLSTSSFGFASPDEAILYTSKNGAINLSDFSRREGAIINPRRNFKDIAFGENESNRHFTLEHFGAVSPDGLAYISELTGFQEESLNLRGQRIFKSAAGVHVYHYSDGQHRLYTIEGAESEVIN